MGRARLFWIPWNSITDLFIQPALSSIIRESSNSNSLHKTYIIRCSSETFTTRTEQKKKLHFTYLSAKWIPKTIWKFCISRPVRMHYFHEAREERVCRLQSFLLGSCLNNASLVLHRLSPRTSQSSRQCRSSWASFGGGFNSNFEHWLRPLWKSIFSLIFVKTWSYFRGLHKTKRESDINASGSS